MTKSTNSHLQISHRAISKSGSTLPHDVEKHRIPFESYIRFSNNVCLQLLSSLSNAMGLDHGSRFEKFHREDQDSNSTLVLLRYPYNGPSEAIYEAGHNKHTDIGSITFLFTDQWGLQVMAAKSDRWEFIEPRQYSAIINVGDSLRFLSQKRLRSCLHRVLPVNANRYTIAYFLRPASDSVFLDSNNDTTSAAQWHDRKYDVFRESHVKQRKDTVLTGGVESVFNAQA
jgi:isopenicillin N synthase-like dioxygenase